MSKNEVSDKELSTIIPILQRLLLSDKQTRDRIQKMGLNILPCNFYSSTPSIEEIENSFEYNTETPPYLNTKIFDDERFLQTLDKLTQFSKEFNPPMDGDEVSCQRFFWKNTMFSHSDAMAYYCFIRLLKPAAIVEIGAGYSTLVALEAAEKNGRGSITCIEPFPRNSLINNKKINLHSIIAQKIQPKFLNDLLQDGDILFIDSTHTVKSGSDCLHIYLRLLPEIKKNIYVHVHDVFLPFGLPKDWLLNHHLFWTEQYLLLAFLIDNPKASLIYGSNYNALRYSTQMKAFMEDKFSIGGGSVWFKYNGSDSNATQS